MFRRLALVTVLVAVFGSAHAQLPAPVAQVLAQQGLPEDALQRWLAEAGWETLLNRKGSTWRQLPPAEQAAMVDAASAAALMRRAPSVIKRPVVAWADGRLTVGFDAEAWARGQQGK